MIKIIIGLFMIALALFDRRQLRNRDSWWAWTNVWARGHRDALGDEGHEQLASVKSVLLICVGVFFILDQIMGWNIIPNSRR